MRHKPGDMIAYCDGLDSVTTTVYTRPGMLEIEKAIRNAMRQNDGEKEDVERFFVEVAAMFGEYSAHVGLALHGGEECATCLIQFYNRLTHAANWTNRMAREEAAASALAIKDGPQIDMTGPEPGEKVN